MTRLAKALFVGYILDRKSKFILSLISVSIFFVSSCGMLTPTHRPDLTPYAENIIKITGDIQYDLSHSQVIYLRHYIDGPIELKLEKYGEKVRNIIRNIIAYSVEIVTLGHSNIPEKEKPKMLADYIDKLLRPMLQGPESRLEFTSVELDTILTHVRKQENLLNGLNAAQPLIDNISATIGKFLDETSEVLDEVIDEVHQQIINDNKLLIAGNKSILASQIETIYNIERLHKYNEENYHTLDSLFLKEPYLKGFVSDPNNILVSEIITIEERLGLKLETLYNIRLQISGDLEIYNRQLHELDEYSKVYNEALRKVKVVVIVWAEAHRRLAAGITDPAKIDIVGLVAKAASSAVK